MLDKLKFSSSKIKERKREREKRVGNEKWFSIWIFVVFERVLAEIFQKRIQN